MARAEHPTLPALSFERIESVFGAEIDAEAGELLRLGRGAAGGVLGYLVRRAFQDVSGIERERWIMGRLRRALGRDAEEVSLIAGCTPEKYEAVLEDF